MTQAQISQALVSFLKELRSKALADYSNIELQDCIEDVTEFWEITEEREDKKTIEIVYTKMTEVLHKSIGRKMYNGTISKSIKL